MTERLTDRQRGVLRARCRGLDADQIAAEFGIASATVKHTLTRVDAQLGVHAGNPSAWACYLLGMADATRVLPTNDAMRSEGV